MMILWMAAAVLGGMIAAVAGFGIGSVLTPLLALRMETRLAVAIVSIPHLAATALRFVLLRRHLDRRIFLAFGLTSAIGGLAGAALHAILQSRVLDLVLGILLVFAGLGGVIGFSQKLRLRGWAASVGGLLSGVFGGLVGNQGGIRSAALLGSGVSKEAFVATATASALVVDVARIPIYLWKEPRALAEFGITMTLLSAGTLLGTAIGMLLLRKIPAAAFLKIVSALILALGIFMLGK